MKKMLSLLVAVIMVVALACPAFAADEFVPSITYKGGPDIVTIKDDQGGNAIGVVREGDEVISYIYGDCLLITPVSQAKTSKKIPAEARDELLFVYEALESGEMKLPYEKAEGYTGETMVIRELLDATWLCGKDGYDHDHPTEVEPEGVVFDITFDLGVKAGTKVIVMTYKNDEWNPIVKVVNNGDGTVTCTFEKLCPVSFSVEEREYNVVPQTGDQSDIGLWIGVLVFSVVALAAVAVIYRRKTAK